MFQLKQKQNGNNQETNGGINMKMEHIQKMNSLQQIINSIDLINMDICKKDGSKSMEQITTHQQVEKSKHNGQDQEITGTMQTLMEKWSQDSKQSLKLNITLKQTDL